MLINSNQLNSLGRVVDFCSKHPNPSSKNVIGVIVDATRPLYRDNDQEYIVEVKIIDDTLNHNKLYSGLIRDCSVYLFSKRREDIDMAFSVGQIVLLENFSFTLWNGLKLETRYQATIESMSYYDPHLEKLTPFLTSHGQSGGLTEELVTKGRRLKEWFMDTYFYREYKPKLGLHLVSDFCVIADPFEMILRMKRTGEKRMMEEGEEELEGQVIELEDESGNVFKVKKRGLPRGVEDNDYVLVRNIKHIGNFYELHLSLTGSILGLPGGFEDFYKQDMNYCAIHRFNENFILKNHQTCELSKLNHVCKTKTPIRELLQNIDLYDSKNRSKDELRVEDLSMIEGIVINFRGNLHLFHNEYQMMVDPKYLDELSHEEKNELLDEGKLQYIYEGVMGLIDRSSEATGKIFYVHLFSNELKTRFFPEEITEAINKKAGTAVGVGMEKEVKKRIDERLQRLLDKSDFSNPVTMLVEPIKSDVLLYRVAHTVF